MAQDPNQQSQYNQGYAGYTPPQSPTNQPYGSGSQSSYATDDQYASNQGYSGSYQQSGYGQQQQQQYSTYQPPQSVTSSTQDRTSTGFNPRTEAVFSYLLGWLSGLIFFLIERKNRFVRFHAAQSFITFGILSIIYFVLRLIAAIPIIGFLLSPILGIATFIVLALGFLLWLFLMFQAYRGNNFRLPIVSNYADILVARFSPRRKSSF